VSNITVISCTNKQGSLINYFTYACTLSVILDSEVFVHVSLIGTMTRQWCHYDTMIKSNSSDLDWREEVRVGHACVGDIGG